MQPERRKTPAAAIARAPGKLRVIKLGGSSFPDAAAYGKIAAYLASRIRNGERFCIVVSAMSGTTGRLNELLADVAGNPGAEDKDTVLSTGEILAAGLMCAALRQTGVRCRSANGFQLGWRASGDFTDADLMAYPPDRLAALLQVSDAVVVSGGQATTNDGRIAMLGRNSSDLTAVACAAALGAPECTIFSDVEGVYTADPYKLRRTRLLPQLSYECAYLYSSLGAKVLHRKCVSFAERHGIEIQCASLVADAMQEYGGTRIGTGGDGVQVIISDTHRLVADTAKTAKRSADPAVANPIAIENKPGWVAVPRDRVDAAQDRLGHAPGSIGQAVVLAVGTDRTPRAFAVPPDQTVRLAQRLHDSLTSESSLPLPSRVLKKHRGTHSDIYSNKPAS